MTIQTVTIADLTPHPKNYNLHGESQLKELAHSLDAFSQYKNIVVSRGVILAGHGLVEAAKRTGMTTIDAVVMDDLTDEQQMSILLADNALAALGTIDAGKLNDLLEDVGDVDIPGLNGDLLDKWLGEVDMRETVRILEEDPEDEQHDDTGHDTHTSSGGQMPVALIFTRDEYDRWQAAKVRFGVKTDTQIALRLLDMAGEEERWH